MRLGEALGLVMFDSSLAFPVGDNPNSVALGDFDGDCVQDLAVANRFGDDVSILLNTLEECWDRDGDGFDDDACGGEDCDDENADVNPGLAEACDGIDTESMTIATVKSMSPASSAR